MKEIRILGRTQSRIQWRAFVSTVVKHVIWRWSLGSTAFLRRDAKRVKHTDF
jgi:hypothetical protein